MGLLVLLQPLVAVAGRCVSDRVETGRIERDHAKHSQHQYKGRARHRIHNVEDQLIKIPAGRVLRDKVRFSFNLQSQAVVSQNNETDDGRSDAENIAAQHSLPDRPAPADIADKERSRDAPHHPVSPVVDRPILREVVGPRRIRISAQLDKVLEHLSKALESVLHDEPSLSADDQHDCQQAKKQIDAKFCQETDSLKSMQHCISINRASDQQNDDRYSRPADADIEQLDDNTRHQRRSN